MKRKRGNWLWGGVLLTAALMLVVAPWGPAWAALPMIDTCDVSQELLIPAGSSNANFVTDSMWGGRRDFSGSRTDSATEAKMAIRGGEQGLCTFNMDVNVVGSGVIKWAGPSGTAVNPPDDLTGGGIYNRFVLTNSGADLETVIQLKVTGTGGTATKDITFVLGSIGSPGTYYVPFTSMGKPYSFFEQVTKIEILIPNTGTVTNHDLQIDSIYLDCIEAPVSITSLTATPNPIPYNQATAQLCWTTSDADRAELNGVDVSVSGCQDVPEGTYKLEAWNECTPTEQSITITKAPPPTGACCVLEQEGENPWEDVYGCLTDVTEEACDGTSGSQGWEEGATNCSLLNCEAPPPPPPPVVPAFNPLGLLIFAGLIPLSWALISRRKK